MIIDAYTIQNHWLDGKQLERILMSAVLFTRTRIVEYKCIRIYNSILVSKALHEKGREAFALSHHASIYIAVPYSRDSFPERIGPSIHQRSYSLYSNLAN